jgi:hypothetical protein
MTSKTENRPKNQHWVPQSYLRRFATPETRESEIPKIYRFDKTKPEVEPHLRSVREVCSSNYLYSPKLPSGERDWSTESMLQEIEADAGEMWPQLDSGDLPLDDVAPRRSIAQFLAAMQVRSMRLFKLQKSTIELRDKLGLLRRDYQPVDGLDARDPGLMFSGTVQKHTPRLTATFAAKRWLVLRCDADLLITSDLPLMFLRPGYKAGGPGTPNTVAAFPVGPRTLLFMDDRLDAPCGYGALDSQLGMTVNRELWARSVRDVLTGRPPAEVRTQMSQQ